jgi:hypothetical protein
MVRHNTAIIKNLNVDDSIQKLYDNTHEEKLYFRNILLKRNKIISDYFPYEISEITIYPFNARSSKRKQKIILKHKIEGLALLITLYFLFYMFIVYKK